MSLMGADVLRLAQGIIDGATIHFAVRRQALATTKLRLSGTREAIDGVHTRVEVVQAIMAANARMLSIQQQQQILDLITGKVGETEARYDQVKSIKARLHDYCLWCERVVKGSYDVAFTAMQNVLQDARASQDGGDFGGGGG